MEIESDPHRLSQLSPSSPERTGIWWVTVIVIGVLIGNLLSFGAYQLYIRWELIQFTVALEAMQTKQAEVTQAERERIAKNNAAIQKERQKQASVNAQLQTTCDFWRQQAQQENTKQNRTFRDIACSRVNGLFR